MKKLTIIRGNSGSGKTTTAKALQQKWGHHVMRISQDMVRREMLRVKDGPDTLAMPLFKELLIYGKNHCEFVILEGIFDAEWYRPLFELAKELYQDQIFAYYYDLPFEETLLRHQTKSNRDEFGEEAMRRWWKEQDLIGFIPEKRIAREQSLESTVLMITRDVMEDKR